MCIYVYMYKIVGDSCTSYACYYRGTRVHAWHYGRGRPRASEVVEAQTASFSFLLPILFHLLYPSYFSTSTYIFSLPSLSPAFPSRTPSLTISSLSFSYSLPLVRY